MTPWQAATLAAVTLAAAPAWRSEPQLPTARGEVAATTYADGIAVVGGLLADGSSSDEVDAYSPSARNWRRLPDLPVAVNHPLAAARRGALYVAGGYDAGGRSRQAWTLAAGRWRALPDLPYPLAAGGAAIVDGRLYLVGGVAGAPDRSVLVRRALVLDLARPTRWRFAPGPTSREHLAVTVARGRVYAVGGRSAGLDTNTRLVQSWRPGERRWRTHAPLPTARGGTGAATVGGTIVSVGGEQPSGTIATVYAYDVSRDVWRRRPNLPTPRHGLGVASAQGRVYVAAGGRVPGLAVSDVVESIAP